MVVEMLTFQVRPDEQAAWLDIEERVWSRFLERQHGFVRKEMWRSVDEPELVHAVIWWASRERWKAITVEQVAEVDAQMGAWFRDSRMVEYVVVRET